MSHVTRRYRGLSGKKGNTMSETRQGNPVKASKIGHKLSVLKSKEIIEALNVSIIECLQQKEFVGVESSGNDLYPVPVEVPCTVRPIFHKSMQTGVERPLLP